MDMLGIKYYPILMHFMFNLTPSFNYTFFCLINPHQGPFHRFHLNNQLQDQFWGHIKTYIMHKMFLFFAPFKVGYIHHIFKVLKSPTKAIEMKGFALLNNELHFLKIECIGMGSIVWECSFPTSFDSCKSVYAPTNVYNFCSKTFTILFCQFILKT